LKIETAQGPETIEYETRVDNVGTPESMYDTEVHLHYAFHYGTSTLHLPFTHTLMLILLFSTTLVRTGNAHK